MITGTLVTGKRKAIIGGVLGMLGSSVGMKKGTSRCARHHTHVLQNGRASKKHDCREHVVSWLEMLGSLTVRLPGYHLGYRVSKSDTARFSSTPWPISMPLVPAER